jgi:hypothetical protein
VSARGRADIDRRVGSWARDNTALIEVTARPSRHDATRGRGFRRVDGASGNGGRTSAPAAVPGWRFRTRGAVLGLDRREGPSGPTPAEPATRDPVTVGRVRPGIRRDEPPGRRHRRREGSLRVRRPATPRRETRILDERSRPDRVGTSFPTDLRQRSRCWLWERRVECRGRGPRVLVAAGAGRAGPDRGHLPGVVPVPQGRPGAGTVAAAEPGPVGDRDGLRPAGRAVPDEADEGAGLVAVATGSSGRCSATPSPSG